VKLLAVGDTHFMGTPPRSRTDDFLKVQLRKFRDVLDLAEKHNALLICMGDVFNKVGVPLDVVNTIMRMLLKHRRTPRQFKPGGEGWRAPMVSPPGNHDLPGAELAAIRRTPFGLLVAAGAIRELTHEPYGPIDGVYIFGHTYMHGEELPEPIAGALNVLVTHDMVIQEELWREQPDDEYELSTTYLENHPGFDLILCGHYHGDFMQRDGDRYIANPGALVRIKASKRDMAMEPGVLLYDTETRRMRRIVIEHEPSEQIMDVSKAETKADVSPVVGELVQAIQTAGGNMPPVRKLSEVIVAHLKTTSCRKSVAKIVRGFFDDAQVTS